MFDRQRIRAGSKYLTDESKMTGSAEYVVTPNDGDELREAIDHRIVVESSRSGSTARIEA